MILKKITSIKLLWNKMKHGGGLGSLLSEEEHSVLNMKKGMVLFKSQHLARS